MPAWSTGCASARPAPYCSCRRLTLLRLTGRTGCAHASRRPSAISKVFLAVIDLNADLGEGVGTDADLLPYITSANVACGAHAGDLETIRRTVELAQIHGVGVGAHPSFPDREGFGRRAMAERAVLLATEHVVSTESGETITVEADTLCIHGDTPRAAALAKAVRQALDQAGVGVSRLDSFL